MKKYILSLLTVGSFMVTYGQQDYQKPPSLGIHFFFNDFETAADIRSNGLAGVIRDKQFAKTKRMSPGLAISYLKGMSKYVDIATTVSGSFVRYDVPGTGKAVSDNFFLEAAATGNLKLLSDKFCLNPFLTLGVGGYAYRKTFGAFIPAGVGMQVKVVKDVFILANSQYRIPVTEKAAYHFYHSVGITAPLVSRMAPVVIPPPPPVVLDRDNDGVLDADDKCPDTPGIAALMGCPDRDADGIADDEDKCPDVAGLSKYGGCPIPDTDGDGINDEIDKCPAVKGVARYQGCPIPDTDGDGINDEEDKCPGRPGPASNMGCPEIAKEIIEKINYAAKRIFFATGSAKLLPKSYKSLDEVVALLNEDSSLMLNINGHTDSTGSADKNLILSDERANSVKSYMAGKGIQESRMTATGFGADVPLDTNKTAAGRAKNRRVAMIVRNY